MGFWRHLAAVACLAGAGLISAADLAQGQVFDSREHRFEAVVLTGGLANPWGLAFLPDGRMRQRVSERSVWVVPIFSPSRV